MFNLFKKNNTKSNKKKPTTTIANNDSTFKDSTIEASSNGRPSTSSTASSTSTPRTSNVSSSHSITSSEDSNPQPKTKLTDLHLSGNEGPSAQLTLASPSSSKQNRNSTLPTNLPSSPNQNSTQLPEPSASPVASLFDEKNAILRMDVHNDDEEHNENSISENDTDTVSVSSLLPKSLKSENDFNFSDDDLALDHQPRVVRAPGRKSRNLQDQISISNTNITKPDSLQIPAIVVIQPSPPLIKSRNSIPSGAHSSEHQTVISERYSINDIPKPSYRHSAPNIQRNSLLDLSIQHQNMLRQQRQEQQQRASYFGGYVGLGGPLLHVDPQADKPVFQTGLVGQVQQQEVMKEMRKNHKHSMVAATTRMSVQYHNHNSSMMPTQPPVHMIPQHSFAAHSMQRAMAQPMMVPPSHTSVHQILPPHHGNNMMMSTPYAMSYVPYADADSDLDEDSASAINRRELKQRWLEQEREKNKGSTQQCIKGAKITSSGASSGSTANRLSRVSNHKRTSDIRRLSKLPAIPASETDSGTESNSTSTKSSGDDEAPLSRLRRLSKTPSNTSPIFYNNSHNHTSSSEHKSLSSRNNANSSPIMSVRESRQPPSSSHLLLSTSFSLSTQHQSSCNISVQPNLSSASVSGNTTKKEAALLDLHDFIKTCLSLQPSVVTSRSKMYSRFVTYMEEVSCGAEEYMVPSMADFEARMEEDGFGKRIREGVGVWMNVTLL